MAQAKNTGLPRNNVPSMAAYFRGMANINSDEKGLLVRMGVLIDAVIQSERGTANVGGVTKRRTRGRSGPLGRRITAHPPVTGTVTNDLRAANVRLNETESPNLSHYEVQIDTDSNFSNPTNIDVFEGAANIKGLSAGVTHSIRVRSVSKIGDTSPFNSLGSVTITTVFANVDGTFLGEDAVSKTFTFTQEDLEVFPMSSTRQITTDDTGGGATVDETDYEIKVRRDTTDIQSIVLPGRASVSPFEPYRMTRYRVPIVFDLITGTAEGDHTFDFRVIEGTDSEKFVEQPSTWAVF